MGDDLDGKITSSAAVRNEHGVSALDGLATRVCTPRIKEATQVLRAAGFRVEHPGRFAISVTGPRSLYEKILGKPPVAPSVERLDANLLTGTPYEPLLAYVAGFEFATPPDYFV